jgi:putative protease
MFELSTNVASPEMLREADTSAYDALYLGDFSCPNLPNNFSSHPELLAEAVENVKSRGQKCYLRLYAVPSNHDLPWVRDLVKTAQALPFDAFEVHNLGLLRMLREMGCDKPIHLGVFGNLYTDATARVLKEYGVTRVYPNPELSLKEVIYIRDHTPIEVLVPVHGKIPLVISETCFILERGRGEDNACQVLCNEEHWLTRSEGQWALKDTGRMTLSGSDLCMLEHVEELAQAKLNAFYVQSHGETAEFVGKVGGIYRQALTAAFAGQSVGDVAPQIAELSVLARMGLCNGYYYESAGRRYLGRA